MQEMEHDDALQILATSRLGVLCLDHDDHSYGIPLFYGFDGDDLYFHCHPGMKDNYLGTKEACLVVIHMEADDIWESVQVFGPLEKLSLNTDIDAAKSALYNVPFPPAEGFRPSGAPVRTDEKVYYLRLRPSRVAGKSSAIKESA